jgi:hypothetical protein
MKKAGSRTPTPPMEPLLWGASQYEHYLQARGSPLAASELRISGDQSFVEGENLASSHHGDGAKVVSERLSYQSTCDTLGLRTLESYALQIHTLDGNSGATTCEAVSIASSVPPSKMTSNEMEKSEISRKRSELNEAGTPSTVDGTPHNYIEPLPWSQSFPGAFLAGNVLPPPSPMGMQISPTATEKHRSVELNKRHRAAKRLSLSEYSAPWPTSSTSMRSPKFSAQEYHKRLNRLLQEFFIAGDYPSFCEQLWQIRSETYNDTTVARIFRMGLEQREVPLDRGQPLSLADSNMVISPRITTLQASPKRKRQ